MLRSRERAVRREQWTEIDRALQRKADGNGLVTYDQFQPRSEVARIRAEQEIDRLQFLSRLGLASVSMSEAGSFPRTMNASCVSAKSPKT